MFTLQSCVKALVAWSLILLVADVLVVSCAHSHHDVAHRRRHTKTHRRLAEPEVVRTRWRRGHAKHSDVSGRKFRHRKFAKYHRSFDDDDVVVRETDKMAAEAINGLFGPRHFAPILSLHPPAKHGKDLPGGKPAVAGRGSHKHRHHHKTGGGQIAEKTFMLELPIGCEAEPCQHDGDCYTDPSSPLGYACRCQHGYTGDFCEIGKRQLPYCRGSPSAVSRIYLVPLANAAWYCVRSRLCVCVCVVL